MKLKELNEKYMKQIDSADKSSIIGIHNIIVDKALLNYDVDSDKMKDYLDDFKELDIDMQKMCLKNILNKNLLYLNYSEIDDEDFNISENDKKLNREFYGEIF